MKAIAAMDLNRAIGINGRIPWHCKEDFAWFKKKTSGGCLIMGRKTFDAVGVLPGRFTYVLTENMSKLVLPPGGAAQYINYQYISDHEMWRDPHTWVCGGASVYKQLFPLCDEFYLTIILDEFEGDTYLPDYESIFPYSEIVQETKQFWIVRYWK